jgi:hypothetical protein
MPHEKGLPQACTHQTDWIALHLPAMSLLGKTGYAHASSQTALLKIEAPAEKGLHNTRPETPKTLEVRPQTTQNWPW